MKVKTELQLNILQTPAGQPLPGIYNEKLWVHKELHSQHAIIYWNSLLLWNYFFKVPNKGGGTVVFLVITYSTQLYKRKPKYCINLHMSIQ